MQVPVTCEELDDTGSSVAALMEGGTERNCSINPPYLPVTVVHTKRRLQALREAMTPETIAAYIIPAADAHLSEYTAPRDARIAFMTGFTGSAGTAVVTATKAVLWTDSRYWVQAERQMDCNWKLERELSISRISDWLLTEFPGGGRIGFDPFVFSLSKKPPCPPILVSPAQRQYNAYSDIQRGVSTDASVSCVVCRLLSSDRSWCTVSTVFVIVGHCHPLETQEYYNANLAPGNLVLTSIPNLVDTIWRDRPPVPPHNLTRLPDQIIGRIWQTKVEEIRMEMMVNPYKPTALLLSALDETAWLFNLRGNDIPHNPFFYSYTLLTMNEIWQRVSEDLKAYLNSSCMGSFCVQLRNYDVVRQDLQRYVEKPGVRVWVGTEYTNYALYEVIAQEKLVTSSYSPVLTTKAVKDETEKRILKNAHVRDAVAVIQLLMWLETAVPQGKETELTAAHYVNECRSKQKDSRGTSFETISASGPNAALAHYSPTNETDRKLTVDEMFLIDSGGQYLDGTTDITRTVHWGTPTAMQREAFTRVLMGNIEISRTVFPTGTKGNMQQLPVQLPVLKAGLFPEDSFLHGFSLPTGSNMEMLARRALWEVGLNYGHGTGHGIGNYFGVHEWPVGFGSNNIPFKEGMFTSIEPGYYKDDDFGIRIEDIAVTVPAHTKYNGQNYLTFDTVSLVPYDRKLIDTSLLSAEQIQWLNRYYSTIRERMGPELDSQGLQREKEWMLHNTESFQTTAGSSGVLSSFTLSLATLTVALLQELI
ncbi:Xaa-Pro aminopeptidase 2 [Merluccius polli]|uniref:Xaa-Pro aminopeptidase 2 n=1 Tax=Merluccius polli TaxID=89951 RepID=A0AA47MZG8_MERPO|nr:Xaa-Pro aminopeptidase 2 [Merluccius polli]